MKTIVQRILGIFGVRLIRSKYARKYLAKPSIDNIEIVVRFYSLMKQKITLLQVGLLLGRRLG